MILRELTLPWPAAALSPNARGHWAKRHRAAQAASTEAYYAAIAYGWRQAELPAEGVLHLSIDFYPARACSIPDDDNMLGRFKAYRDGLAEALGINDRRFRSHPVVHAEVRKGGEVRVRLTAEAPTGA